MTIWIIRQPNAPTTATKELRLPFAGLPDLSGVRSEADMRRLLQTLSPDTPPETIVRQAEVHWRNVSELMAHDVVLVPLANKAGYAIGEITAPYAYRVENGEDVHSANIRWLDMHVPRRKLTMVKDEAVAMQKIESPEARKQIFALTPHPTNRFAKWRWLIVLMFILQAVVMLIPILRLSER